MRLALAAAAASVALVASSPVAEAAKVVPKNAVPGATVELRGGDVPEKGKVKVAGKGAEVVSREKSRVRFVVPKVRAGEQPVRMGDAEATMEVLKRFRGKVGVGLAKNKATSKQIGPGGDSITATHDGMTYTLDVPAGALTEAAPITMTPVAELKNLPLTRNRPAAVQLRPDGLQFATPAELSITGLKPGNQVGFTMTDAGRGLELVDATRQGNSVVVSIEHFTTSGAGGATEQDFVNFLRNFLDTSQAILTLGSVAALLNERGLAEKRFPGFCARQVVCKDVENRVRASVVRLFEIECDNQAAQPTVGGLSVLIDLAANLMLVGGNPPDCVRPLVKALVDRAVANVKTNPFGDSGTDLQLNDEDLATANLDPNTPVETGEARLSWIEWVFQLAKSISALPYTDLTEQLLSEFIAALQKALDDGRALCGSDTPNGLALLERGYAIARHFDATIDSRLDSLRLAYAEALENCEPAGGVTFITRTAEVDAGANSKDDRKTLSDPRAPFSAIATATETFPCGTASATASQTSSIALSDRSLNFVLDGDAQATEPAGCSASSYTTAEVEFQTTRSLPYSVRGSATSSGTGGSVEIRLEDAGNPAIINFNSSTSTWQDQSGTLPPGDYELQIEISSGPTAGTTSASNEADMRLLVNQN